MNRARTRTLKIWITIGLIGGSWAAGAASGQTAAPGARIWNKLERAALIDPYFPEIVYEVAQSLAQAAPGQWRGVQVNSAYRAGWVNVYTVDARRLPNDPLLAEEGLANFTPESLEAGALADEETGVIFLNTAMWKRLTAATLMTQTKVQPDLTAALAFVESVGLEATRNAWAPASLAADTPENRRTGWLLRGALAFVLAHEMGHLRIGRSPSIEPDAIRLKNLTERQKDEHYACPETLNPGFRQQQKQEHAADLAAVRLLGQQCRIGPDGPLRHSIYMLGTTWYFLSSMSDKLIQMGRSTSSPIIAQALRNKIGPALYQQVIAARASNEKKGAVRPAFPSTHPPDTARMQSIEAALRATPCGSGGLDSAGPQMLEMYRLQMCRGLTGQEPVR